VHSLVDDCGIGVAEEGQEAAALPIALRERAHDIEFDVLLQRAPPDAKDGRHAEPKPQRLKQQAAPHGLRCGKVSSDLVEVQRHRLPAQERGLRGLTRDCDVCATGSRVVLAVDSVGVSVGGGGAAGGGHGGLRRDVAGHSAAEVEVIDLRTE
jgi:hypothetical protein